MGWWEQQGLALPVSLSFLLGIGVSVGSMSLVYSQACSKLVITKSLQQASVVWVAPCDWRDEAFKFGVMGVVGV